jgi:hypothetical protein
MIALFSPKISHADAHGGVFTTREVLDGFPSNKIFLGYVSGLNAGLFTHHVITAKTHGVKLFCIPENLNLPAREFISVLNGELAKLDPTTKQRYMTGSFPVVAVILMGKAFPCE